MSDGLPSEKDQRAYWRLLWLSAIQAFADSETQQRRWLDLEEHNPHFSYVECMNCYFDDAIMGDDGAYLSRFERGHVTQLEMDAVAEFHRLAASHNSPRNDDYDHKAILNDPDWMAVVQAAQEALESLRPLLTDAVELRAISAPASWEEKDGVFRSRLTGSTIIILGEPNSGRSIVDRIRDWWRRKS